MRKPSNSKPKQKRKKSSVDWHVQRLEELEALDIKYFAIIFEAAQLVDTNQEIKDFAYRLHLLFNEIQKDQCRSDNRYRQIWLQSAFSIKDKILFKAALNSEQLTWGWDTNYPDEFVRGLWHNITWWASAYDDYFFKELLNYKFPLPICINHRDSQKSWMESSLFYSRDIKPKRHEKIIKTIVSTLKDCKPLLTRDYALLGDYPSSMRTPTKLEVHREITDGVNALATAKFPVKTLLQLFTGTWGSTYLKPLALGVLSNNTQPQEIKHVLEFCQQHYPHLLLDPKFHTALWESLFSSWHTSTGLTGAAKQLIKFKIKSPPDVIYKLRAVEIHKVIKTNSLYDNDEITKIEVAPTYVKILRLLVAANDLQPTYQAPGKAPVLVDVLENPELVKVYLELGVDPNQGVPLLSEKVPLDTLRILLPHTTILETVFKSLPAILLKHHGLEGLPFALSLFERGANPKHDELENIITAILEAHDEGKTKFYNDLAYVKMQLEAVGVKPATTHQMHDWPEDFVKVLKARKATPNLKIKSEIAAMSTSIELQ